MTHPMEKYVDAYFELSDADKELVGLTQEAMLREDESGGEDGMWFCKALRRVQEARS